MFDWTSLLSGIQFLLGFQLLIVACIHLVTKPKDGSIPLGVLCLIHALWFFKSVFPSGYWQNNLLLFLLIGPGKPIFAGSLLLFYYKSYSSKLSSRYILLYLIAPTIYYLLLLFFRFLILGNSPVFNQKLSLFFTAGVFVIFWLYFFITRYELKTNTQKKLIPKAYRKVIFLFYSLYFFLLQIPVWDMLRHLVSLRILPDKLHHTVAHLYETVFIYGEYIVYSYLHILGYFLFLYAMSEVSFFKQLFLPKETAVNENIIRDKAKIDGLVEQYFGREKLFKNPELSLSSCANTFNISRKELMDYLKISQQGVFRDFVNKWRVNEFKLLAKDEKFRHYDLVGLAKECGFNSKSTFFRVFKDMEGMTPNQYKNTQQ